MRIGDAKKYFFLVIILQNQLCISKTVLFRYIIHIHMFREEIYVAKSFSDHKKDCTLFICAHYKGRLD